MDTPAYGGPGNAAGTGCMGLSNDGNAAGELSAANGLFVLNPLGDVEAANGLLAEAEPDGEATIANGSVARGSLNATGSICRCAIC